MAARDRSHSPVRNRSASPPRQRDNDNNGRDNDRAAEFRVFVGNLSFDVTNEDLEDSFKEFHPLSVHIPTDPMTGRSRGFAFVAFKEDRDASEAIREWNGKKLKGRELRVDRAEERKGGGGGGGRGRGGRRGDRGGDRGFGRGRFGGGGRGGFRDRDRDNGGRDDRGYGGGDRERSHFRDGF